MARNQDGIDRFLQKLEAAAEGSSAAQNVALAESLRSLWPGVPVAAWICEADPMPIVLDANGAIHESGAAAVFAAQAEIRWQEQRVAFIEVPALRHWLLAGLVHHGQCFGLLGVALPRDESAEMLLMMTAAVVAARLAKERESAELHFRAFLGDLAPPLAHECNNFLNVVLLQVAVLEMDIPGAFTGQLAEIRRQAGRFQKLVEQFHAYRNTQPAKLTSIRLEDTLGKMERDQRVRVAAHPSLPPVLATSSDLDNLLGFFVSHATHWCGEQPCLEIEAAGDKVVLSLGCPQADADADSLDWCACQSLARRLQGKSFSRRRADGGTDYVVELKRADE